MYLHPPQAMQLCLNSNGRGTLSRLFSVLLVHDHGYLSVTSRMAVLTVLMLTVFHTSAWLQVVVELDGHPVEL